MTDSKHRVELPEEPEYPQSIEGDCAWGIDSDLKSAMDRADHMGNDFMATTLNNLLAAHRIEWEDQ